MPDISMCLGNDCTVKMQCFRYRAEPNPYRQSYLDPKYHQLDSKCSAFTSTKNFSAYKLRDLTTEGNVNEEVNQNNPETSDDSTSN